MDIRKKKILKLSFIIILVILAISLIWYSSIKPSNDRDWALDQARLPYAEIENNSVKVFNVRNFTYKNTTSYTPSYYNKTYDLSKLDSLWYIVEPFSDWEGAAHTFLSFGFGNEYLALSVEIRKEKGEDFSAIRGLFKTYELMYVLGDERDLIKLRSNYRQDKVFLYPVKTQKETIEAVFLDVIKRTNKLKESPEFYNTLTNTCTTNVANHANNIKPGRIPFSLKILAPGFSDKLAYDLDIIDTNLSFEEARQYFKINEKANTYQNYSDFPNKIRNT